MSLSIDYLQQEWGVISAAPFLTATLMCIAASTGFAVAKVFYMNFAGLADKQRKFSEQQLQKLQNDIRLLKEIGSTDAAVEALRERIDKMPQTVTGPNPPPGVPREGTIWFKTEV